MELLTISRLRTWRGCPRRHHYAFDLCYRPIAQAAPARFGSIWHVGLEQYWLAVGEKRPVDEWLELALVAAKARWLSAGDEEPDPFELVKAEELLLGYHVRWSEKDRARRVLGVELAFRMPLVNPATGRASRTYELGGQMDALFQDLDDDVWLMEHKTSSEDLSPGSDYWRRLRLDGQISLYYAACQRLGYPVQGCLYDVVKRPALRPSRATPEDKRKYKKDGSLYANQRDRDETPDEYRLRLREHITQHPADYFARGSVTRLESDVRDAQWDVWHAARMIRESQLADRHPRNPGACLQYGRTCEYFAVCAGEASLDDLAKFRRLETAHPELEEHHGQERQAS